MQAAVGQHVAVEAPDAIPPEEIYPAAAEEYPAAEVGWVPGPGTAKAEENTKMNRKNKQTDGSQAK